MTTAVPPLSAEVLPPSLTSISEPPTLFDGTTRLYIAYMCPYARRAWTARNFKDLQDKIELVPIDLDNRPAWYKEKVYPGDKVPSLEHNNEVTGESLDLVKYIDANFEGPALLPDDSAKQQFAEELLSYSDSFNMVMYKAIRAEGDISSGVDPAFNKIEDALSRFGDGRFFLGQFSLVDIAYGPFIELFNAVFLDVKNYDATKGRPKLSLWLEDAGYDNTVSWMVKKTVQCLALAELNKMDAYTQTGVVGLKELVAGIKKRFGIA